MIPYAKIRQLHIEASSYCNASCPACSRIDRGLAKFATFKSTNLTLLHHQNFFPSELVAQLDSIVYCGNLGDPTMNPELVEICRWWFSQNPRIRIRIHTNGGTRGPKFWSDLGSLFKGTSSSVVFSVDGLEDTNHIYRRGVIWKKVVNAIETYRAPGGPADWEYLVFRHNQHQIEEARLLARRWGFENFYVKKAIGFVSRGEVNAIDAYKKSGELDYSIYPPDEAALRNSVINEILEVKATQAVNKINATAPENSVKATQTTLDAQARCEVPSTPKTKQGLRILEHLGVLPSLEKHLNSAEVDCWAVRESNLFVSSEGLVFPCCFIGSRFYAADLGSFANVQIQHVLKNRGKEQFSLWHREFREIVNDPWFQNKFSESWTKPSIRSGKLAICAESCAKGHTQVKSAMAHLLKS